MMKRHVWMEAETCGDSWKAAKSILIFIYTSVISISLAGKPSTQRIELFCSLSLSSLPLLPFRCRICSYLVYFTTSGRSVRQFS